MQSGDTVKVYVIDSQTYPSVWYLVDTIATNVSCSQRSKAFNNPNWTGHLMQVRFIGNFSSTATIAYVDYVSFWQKTFSPTASGVSAPKLPRENTGWSYLGP
jgi:hypothetical protein